MKIEMGESLMYSWLRHVVECQIAQLNWKTSIINVIRQNEIEELYKFFKDELQLKSTLPQFLRQAEIDVLGIKTMNQNYDVFAIDIAFHEAGLGYKDSAERVIKKLLRSALILHNQFNLKTGRLIFACPIIKNKDVINEIILGINNLNDNFTKYGFNYSFELICNEDFQSQILNKVIDKSPLIKDTSDLFVRSLKMLGIFNAQIGGANLSATIDSTITTEADEFIPDVDVPFQTLDDIYSSSYFELLNSNFKIGQKAQYFFDKLKADKKIISFFNKNTNLTIQGFPILVDVTNKTDEEIRCLKTNGRDDKNLRLKSNGRDDIRYYASAYESEGKTFILCSQWYPKHLEDLINIMKEMKLI